MFRYLEYIYCVYQEKSFSRAAERLYISQSSLSLTIKKAEERIGAQIFDRKTNPLTLTEFGQEYIAAAEKVMSLENNLENSLEEAKKLTKGHISLGAANFCMGTLLPGVLTAFQKKYPGIKVELREGSTAELIRTLSEGRIDMMVSNMVLDERFYLGTFFCKEKLVLAVPKELCPSEAFARAGLSFKEYVAGKPCCYNETLPKCPPLPCVLLRPGNDSRNRADKLMHQYGIMPEIVQELDQLSTAYQFACAGMGATIASDVLICRAGIKENMLYYPLRGPLAEREIQIYARKNYQPTYAMGAFIRTAREEANAAVL